MIVRCPDCRTKYEIATDRVPEAAFKLRCPRCKAVFPVSGGMEAAASEVSEGGAVRARETAPLPRLPLGNGSGAAEFPPPPSRPRITDPGLARRMARAMISEMVLNRRTERDEALRTGTLLSRFGPAIAAAFEIYEKKTSPDLGAAPGLFREAVNEILGEGEPVL